MKKVNDRNKCNVLTMAFFVMLFFGLLAMKAYATDGCDNNLKDTVAFRSAWAAEKAEKSKDTTQREDPEKPAASTIRRCPFKPGDKVEVFLIKDSEWYNAAVTKNEGGRCFIHYDKYDYSYDEWVGSDRIRAKEGKEEYRRPKAILDLFR